MAKQILGSDEILRINNYSLLGLVQNSNWAPNFNAQDVFELGKQTRVDTANELETSGSFETESAGNTPGLLARMITKRTNGSFTGYLFSGTTAATNKNAYTITEADVTEAQFDLVIHERPDQVNYTRSTYVPRAFLASISGRVDANGMGTETVNWNAQEAYQFDTPYHDIVAVPLTRTTSTTATIINSDEVTVNAAGYTGIYFYVDEKRYRGAASGDASNFTFATTIVTLVGGDTIPADAVLRAVFYKTASPSSTFPALLDTRRDTVAHYVKGYQANLYLDVSNAAAPASSEQLFKAQSADWSMDFNLTPLRQIALNTAGTSIYCRVPTTPFNVSLNATFYDADSNEWLRVLLRGGTNPKYPASGNNVWTDSKDWAPQNLLGDPAVAPLKATLVYYTKSGNELQKIEFLDLRVDAYSNRVGVGGRGETTLSLRGSKFIVLGANPVS